MCQPSPPPAPDYTGAAEATAAGNLEASRASTQANRPDEYTPFGQRTWTNLGSEEFNQPGFEQATQDWQAEQARYQRDRDAGISWGTPPSATAPTEADFTTKLDADRWRSDVSLSPEIQELLSSGLATQKGLAGLGEGAIGRVGESLSDPFSIEGEAPTFQGPQGELGSYGANRQRVMDAMMGRVGTDIGRDRERRRSQLVAQGIPVGSEAYNREMEQLDRQMTDARQQAEIAATQQAGQEYGADIMGRQQMGREGMDVFGTGTDARNQAIKEAMLKRSLPLSELSSIMTGSQPQLPNFQPYGQQGQVAGPDYLGAAGAQSGYDLGGYNAGVAGQNQLMSGLFGLGAAGIMASDIRLKKDITRVGELPSGIPIYNYSYIDENHLRVGVMAQDVLKVIPDAVVVMGNGYYAVDYLRIH